MCVCLCEFVQSEELSLERTLYKLFLSTGIHDGKCDGNEMWHLGWFVCVYVVLITPKWRLIRRCYTHNRGLSHLLSLSLSINIYSPYLQIDCYVSRTLTNTGVYLRQVKV